LPALGFSSGFTTDIFLEVHLMTPINSHTTLQIDIIQSSTSENFESSLISLDILERF
jgi:hypothetical protein